MKILVCPNFSKSNTEKTLTEALKILKENSVEILIFDEYKSKISGEFSFGKEKDLLPICDIVIAIGGDGTIIDMAKKAAFYNKAVLGINCGRIGFLAGLESEELAELNRLIKGEYKIEKSTMLEVFSKSNRDKIYYCVNDAVLSRTLFPKMVDVELKYLDNSLSIRADGVVVATPVGSTAYSMSAGGPVVDHSVGGIIVTPICPYSFFSRSIIINEENEIELKSSHENENLSLTIDGERLENFSANEVFVIKKSKYDVQFIKLGKNSLFSKLTEKIK